MRRMFSAVGAVNLIHEIFRQDRASEKSPHADGIPENTTTALPSEPGEVPPLPRLAPDIRCLSLLARRLVIPLTAESAWPPTPSIRSDDWRPYHARYHRGNTHGKEWHRATLDQPETP